MANRKGSRSRKPSTTQSQLSKSQSFQLMKEESRPAQLAPELIEKYTPEHIDRMVTSLEHSIVHQDETRRIGVEKHYESINRSETKKYLSATLSLLLLVIAKSYMDLDWPSLLVLSLVFFSTVFAQTLSSPFVKLFNAWISRKTNNPENNE